MTPQALIVAYRAEMARVYGSAIGDAIDLVYHRGWFYPTLAPGDRRGSLVGCSGFAYRRATVEAILEELQARPSSSSCP